MTITKMETTVEWYKALKSSKNGSRIKLTVYKDGKPVNSK